jgi:hypothetical protein
VFTGRGPKIVKIIPLIGVLFTVLFKQKYKTPGQFKYAAVPFPTGTGKGNRASVNIQIVM